jgi:hypothetical protein
MQAPLDHGDACRRLAHATGIPEGKLYSYFNNIGVRRFILKRAKVFRGIL